MNWYLQVLKKYAVFSGRARRTEYWMFFLFNFIFFIAAMIIDNVAGTTIDKLPYGLFYFLYAFAVLIPGLAVAVRRLHDVGKSGWMILISLIPLVGAIWFLVLTVTDSDAGENEYGPNPKEMQTGTAALEDNSTTDTIILIIVIWLLITRLFWATVPKIVDNFYSTEIFKYLSLIMNIFWSFVPLLLTFVVKEKIKKTIILIFGIIYLLYGLYEAIFQFVN